MPIAPVAPVKPCKPWKPGKPIGPPSPVAPVYPGGPFGPEHNTKWKSIVEVNLDYTQRLAHLGLETLQIRRIKYDLQLCFKIINGDISLHCNMFDLSNLTHTRGHKYKLYKHQSNVNAYKHFFCNRVCDIWNMLPEYVVDAPSFDSFKRRLNSIDLLQFVVLP